MSRDSQIASAGRTATTARSDTKRGATSLPRAARVAQARATGQTQQRNRALAIVLSAVALFVLMIVIGLVVFLHDEAAHPLATL